MARKKNQTGNENIASGNDRVSVQGPVHGSNKGSKDGKKNQPPASPGRVRNVCTGNARVGIQTDEIQGDVCLWM